MLIYDMDETLNSEPKLTARYLSSFKKVKSHVDIRS